MTILVTGATSGLGRNAVEWLHAQGVAVRATGRDLARGTQLQQRGIEFVPADLARISAEQADHLLRDVDIVWHCAALSSPWGQPDDFYDANVRATSLLAEAAVARDVRRFIHISTPSIYFDYQHRRDIPEAHRARRYANYYAHTKALAEDRLQGMVAAHPRTCFVLLRPRGLFGPHDRVVLPRILRLLRERKGVLPLPRGGEALIDLTYVGTVVHAMQLASQLAGLASGSAYNISNQEPSTLKALLRRLLGDALQLDYRVKSMPYPLLDIASRGMEQWSRLSGREPMFTRYSMGALHFDMTLSNAKAQRELGYYPPVDMHAGIQQTAQWIRAHGTHHHL
ncbi:NAD-dependent epimerase/dehydratase family protein [Dyella silvatica]|uniref:NAD-dependent epimerase/dehydratase family protein n=1 Tax=Dyella silvatica TaxID=2992128 RepID=UPI00224FD5CE|nr:NAD(P)-dependent oxidoreductase [Dyella silvatica]